MAAFDLASHSKLDPGKLLSPPNPHQTPKRPAFNSYLTSDRLRAATTIVAKPTMASNIKKGRKSIFREVGLDGDYEVQCLEKSFFLQQEKERVDQENQQEQVADLPSPTFSPTSDITPFSDEYDDDDDEGGARGKVGWLSRLTPARRPKVKSATSGPPSPISSLVRLSMITLLIALVIPSLRYHRFNDATGEIGTAHAGVIPSESAAMLHHRQDDSQTDVCKRFSGQSAVLNGTMYYYGGQIKTSSGPNANEWTNDFVTLDLTTSWPITSPPFTGLPKPSGPPAVSLGSLWASYTQLILYGGAYSDNPPTDPSPFSTWIFDITSQSWTSYSDPVTSAGNFSTAANLPVQNAAEGAGISVPELGVSWYFGGHLDHYTTPGWSDTIAKVYLTSLLEYTHPGYANNALPSLRATGAPDSGSYRNITRGGIQDDSATFAERADGVLVFVPGWGPRGILLGLGGGTRNAQDTAGEFSGMEVIDVYDIDSSKWYHQEVAGAERPRGRVNPCAVVFSAADASSFNIYLYGGQNLVPYEQQIQYDDLWILTVPSFTWVKVQADGDGDGAKPPARVGHMCAARDGQMVVWGGYTGQGNTCEKPGVFALDASELTWRGEFTAGDHDADLHPENSVLAGSWGYLVPSAVQDVIGGSESGGATASTPAAGPATSGPFATGEPPVFTITAPGETATVTNGPAGDNVGGSDDGEPNPGLIAAGVIAGLLGLAAGYLGFCAYIYRRQNGAYKRHVAAANRYSHDPSSAFFAPFGAGATGAWGGRDEPKESSLREKLRKQPRFGGADDDTEHFAWVGRPDSLQHGSKWNTERSSSYYNSSDNPSPGSGPGPSAVGRNSGPFGPGLLNEDHRFAYDSYPFGAYAAGGVQRYKSVASRSSGTGTTASGSEAEQALLNGREPSFFSVVLGPRRALRVVNGLEGE